LNHGSRIKGIPRRESAFLATALIRSDEVRS